VALLLKSRPDQATWLTDAERQWLRRTIAAERAESAGEGSPSLLQALAHRRVLALALTYFFLILSLAGTSLWMPLMLKQFGLSNTGIGWVLLIPNAIAVVGLQLWTFSSDRLHERTWHIIAGCFVVALGVLATANTFSASLALAGMTCIIMGSWAAIAIFWTRPTEFLSGVAAAGAVALINSVGNLSGFLGPYLIGLIHDKTGSFTLSLYGLAASNIIAAALIYLLSRAKSSA
jgi:ACS family tartrate transporter-like MFS transporter